MLFFNQGVALGRPNRSRDLALVQRLLNMTLAQLHRDRGRLLHPLDETGLPIGWSEHKRCFKAAKHALGIH